MIRFIFIRQMKIYGEAFDMTFEEVWSQVRGLPDAAKMQVPGILKEDTKKRLCQKRPEEVTEIVALAIKEVNHGSIEPLDTLIKKRL